MAGGKVDGGGARGSTNLPWNRLVKPIGISRGLGVGGGEPTGVNVVRAARISREASLSCLS